MEVKHRIDVSTTVELDESERFDWSPYRSSTTLRVHEIQVDGLEIYGVRVRGFLLKADGTEGERAATRYIGNSDLLPICLEAQRQHLAKIKEVAAPQHNV